MAGKKRKRNNGAVAVPRDYHPAEGEEFMNPVQREYFRQRLLRWRAEIIAESSQTLVHLQEETHRESDLADRASIESERLVELRTRDRERKLLDKIDSALWRLENGKYGYCEETGDPISVARLEARPIATLSIDAQERHEQMEKTHRAD